MKQLTILLFLLITLIGCGSNSTQKQNKITNIITKEITLPSTFWNLELLNKEKYFKVFEKQSDYDAFVDELNSALSNIPESTPVSKTDIDFENNYILVYVTKYNAFGQIDEYNEYITLDGNSSATIEQKFTGHKKIAQDTDDHETYMQNSYTMAGLQIRVYKISKEILSIKMIHEDEISYISKEYPNGIPNTKVINLINTRISENENLFPFTIKLFDTNNSFQEFVISNNISENLQNININFNKYRVLFHSIHNGCYTKNKLYFDIEDINYPNNFTANIIQSTIIPKNMSMEVLAVCATATEEQVRVYAVSRDIENIIISSHQESNITITADDAI